MNGLSCTILRLVLPAAALASALAAFGTAPLTPAERNYLRAHGPIRYAPDPAFPPLEFLDAEGQAQGITPDLLALMARHVGATLTTVPCPSWTGALDAVRRGGADLLGTVTPTREREVFLLFSKPYMSVPYALFVRDGGPRIKDLTDMEGLHLGVVDGYGILSWLETKHPGLALVLVPDVATGMTRLASGNLDAMLETLPVGLYVVREKSLTNIKMLPGTVYEVPQCLAVSRGNGLLLSIVQKGLDSLTAKEKVAVFEKWTGHDFFPEPWYRRGPIQTTALIAFLILAALAAWVILLKRAVARGMRAERQAAQALRESEERFAAFMSYLPAVAVMRDPQGRYVYMNEAWERAMALRREDFMGQTPYDCFPAKDASKLLADDRRVLETGEAVSGEMELHHGDGPRRWFTSHFPIRHPSGRIGLVGILYVDITALKASEAALRESELRFRTLAETTRTAIFMYQGERMIYANPATSHYTGYTEGELLRLNIFDDLVHPDYREGVRDLGRRRLAGENNIPDRHEFPIVRKDGALRWVEYTASVAEQAGTPTAIASAYDITGRMKAEAELAEAKKFEAIGMIANGVAHEVRNPLFAIQTIVLALQKKLAGKTEFDEYVRHVAEQTGRLNALMSDLLLLGRPVEPSAFKRLLLVDVLEESLNALMPAWPEVRALCVLDLPNASLRVMGSKEKLVQVIVNLIDNALSLSGGEGPVTVRLRREGSQARLAIQDAGPGVPAEFLPKLFTPFASQRKGGTGLGLAIAMKIVQAHGGTLTAANNDPGPGATFTVMLPAAE